MSRPNGYSAPWTEADHAYLRENYGTVPVREMATKLGRSAKAIYGQADLLRISGTSRPWTAAEEDVIRANLGRITEAEIGKPDRPQRESREPSRQRGDGSQPAGGGPVVHSHRA